MAVLVKVKALGKDSLHLRITKERVAAAVRGKFSGIEGDKLKSGAIRIEYLAATCRVFGAVVVLLQRVAQADVSLVSPVICKLPRYAACLRVKGDAHTPHHLGAVALSCTFLYDLERYAARSKLSL